MHFTDVTGGKNSHKTHEVSVRREVPSPGESKQAALEGQWDSSDGGNLPSQGVGQGRKLLRRQSPHRRAEQGALGCL